MAISTLLGALTISTHAQAATPLKVAVKAPVKYKLDVLRVGKQTHVDRDHKFFSVPSRYAGLCYLRTANDDHYIRNGQFVDLNTNKPVTVFVGLDSRMGSVPGWMNKGWKKTGHTLGFKAYYRQKFVMYQKNFPAGKVVLGGNEKGYKTYVVALKDRDRSAPKTCKIQNSVASNESPSESGPSKRLALKIKAGFEHQIDVVQNNKRAYTDLDFRLTAVPTKYRGMCYVRPADENNTQSDERALVLNANKKVNVYVGFDARIRELPAWVNKSWKKTGDAIGLQAKYRQKMILYRKTFSAGNIVLGSNEMGMRHYVTVVEDPRANGVTSCNGGGGAKPQNGGGAKQQDVGAAQPQKTTLTFSWQPSGGNVNGYRIYHGNAAGNVGRLVSVVRVNNANFDPARPSMKFDAWKLLGQFEGKNACFKVSAFNGTGESKKSSPLCMKL